MEKYEEKHIIISRNGTKIIETELEGCFIVEPVKHGDNRGYFQETFNINTLKEAGIMLNPVQGNECLH